MGQFGSEEAGHTRKRDESFGFTGIFGGDAATKKVRAQDEICRYHCAGDHHAEGGYGERADVEEGNHEKQYNVNERYGGGVWEGAPSRVKIYSGETIRSRRESNGVECSGRRGSGRISLQSPSRVEGNNMTETSQQFSVPREQAAVPTRSQGSAIAKAAVAWVFVCALGLAPMPAFAQHGGGGGGGGSHGGGGGLGGGGGSHGGSGGGGGSASAPSGAGSHASGASAASNAGGNSGGHWWNPFHSGSTTSAAAAKGGVPAGNIKSESSATGTPEHFAAGNNTWLEPPSASARAAARVNYYGPANVNPSRPFVPLSSTTRGSVGSARAGAMVAATQHPFQPVRPGYPYYPYYPYFGYAPYYGGLGFGFGGFGPCDPFWGCYGYGFGYGFGGGLGYFGGNYGFGGDLSYGPGWAGASAEGLGNATSPDNPNSYLYAVPGTSGAPAADSSAAAQTTPGDSAQQPTYVLLYLKDGSSFAVTDYWLTGGKLHYVTSYGGDNAVDQSQVDLQRTVNENAARGVGFSLRPQPSGNGDAATPTQSPEPERLQK